MRLSTPDALGFTALLRARTTYDYGAARPKRDCRLPGLMHDCCIMQGGVHHRATRHHGAAVARRPGRAAASHHKLDAVVSQFIASCSLGR
jgi:hypothetical protein